MPKKLLDQPDSTSVELKQNGTEEVKTIIDGEDYSVVNTKCSKDSLIEDGWVQETKEPFLDVDGKLKLLFHKKSFYKFLEES